MIKITRLTRFNVDASQAQRLLVTLQQRAAQRSGTGGHPYKSLFAVARRISTLEEGTMNGGRQVERFTRRDITGIAVETGTPIPDVADVVYRLITVLGYDAVVASADSVLGNHELTETAAARVRDTVLDRSCQRVALPDGEVSVFEPAPDTDDASRMYGLDVLEFSIMVRRKREEDGTVTSVVEISEDPGGVLEVIVRGIENVYGDREDDDDDDVSDDAEW